ncbi:uncharacterized protein METZ01_LOCUS248229, partial [marine metagenome]
VTQQLTLVTSFEDLLSNPAIQVTRDHQTSFRPQRWCHVDAMGSGVTAPGPDT